MAALTYLKYLMPQGCNAPTLVQTKERPGDVHTRTTFRYADTVRISNNRLTFLGGRMDRNGIIHGAPAALQNEKQRLELTVTALESDKACLMEQLEETQSKVKCERKRCREMDAEIARLRSTLHDTQATLDAERDRCNDLTASMSALQEERQGLLDLQAAHVVDMQAAQGDLADALLRVSALLTEKVSLVVSLQYSQSRVGQLEAQTESQESELRTKDKQLASALEDIAKYETLIADLRGSGGSHAAKLKLANETILAEHKKLEVALFTLQMLERERGEFKTSFHRAEEELARAREALSAAQSKIHEERAAKEHAFRDLEESMANAEQLEFEARQRERKLRKELEEESRQRLNVEKTFQDVQAQFEAMRKENNELKQANGRWRQQLEIEQRAERNFCTEVVRLREELAGVQTQHEAAVAKRNDFEEEATARMMELADENTVLAKEKRILQEKVHALVEAKTQSDAQNHKATEAAKQNVQAHAQVKQELSNVRAMLTAQLDAVDKENTVLRTSLNAMSASATALQEARRVNAALTEEMARCRCRKVLKDVSNVMEGVENRRMGENTSKEKMKASPLKRWDSLFWKRQEVPFGEAD